MRALVFLFILLCAAAPLSGAAAFPVLKAPASYAGVVEAEGARYAVTLRLKADHHFVLREERGKNQRTLTGRWFQTDGGAILQLSNRNGLEKRLNVGGAGTLYAGVQAPFTQYRNVALESVPDVPFPYAVMGTLSFGSDGVWLRDAATGTASRLLPDPQLAHLPRKALFTDMDVEEDGSNLRLLRLRSAAETFPPLQETTPELFRRQVVPLSWQLILNGHPLHCVFRETLLVVTDDKARIEIPYTLAADSITFRTDAKIAALWDAFGLREAGRLLSGKYVWDLNGKVLSLQSDDTTLCVLEKIG